MNDGKPTVVEYSELGDLAKRLIEKRRDENKKNDIIDLLLMEDWNTELEISLIIYSLSTSSKGTVEMEGYGR